MNQQTKAQLLIQLNEAESAITLSINRGPMQLTPSKVKAIDAQGSIREAIKTLGDL